MNYATEEENESKLMSVFIPFSGNSTSIYGNASKAFNGFQQQRRKSKEVRERER